jgi:hypothetical protein
MPLGTATGFDLPVMPLPAVDPLKAIGARKKLAGLVKLYFMKALTVDEAFKSE